MTKHEDENRDPGASPRWNPTLPRFILIGAMKAGTTTLYRRLRQNSELCLPLPKEPDFFSVEEKWQLGPEWYRSHFDGCQGIRGEGSTSYSDARTADVVVNRMALMIPEVRLVYLLRDPVERIRSHYRHQVLRNRETRPLRVALAAPDNEYLASSCYGRVLMAYRAKFESDQILTIDTEDIDDLAVWDRILSHIGAATAPMPTDVHNTSDEKQQFTPLLLKIWERNSGIRVPRLLPRSVRAIAKRLLTREPDASGPISTVDDDIPSSTIQILREDRKVLESLGVEPRTSWENLG